MERANARSFVVVTGATVLGSVCLPWAATPLARTRAPAASGSALLMSTWISKSDRLGEKPFSPRLNKKYLGDQQ